MTLPAAQDIAVAAVSTGENVTTQENGSGLRDFLSTTLRGFQSTWIQKRNCTQRIMTVPLRLKNVLEMYQQFEEEEGESLNNSVFCVRHPEKLS